MEEVGLAADDYVGAWRHGVGTRGGCTDVKGTTPQGSIRMEMLERVVQGMNKGQEAIQFGNAMVVVVLDTTRGNAQE